MYATHSTFPLAAVPAPLTLQAWHHRNLAPSPFTIYYPVLQDIVAIHGDQITQSGHTLAFCFIKPRIQLGGKPGKVTVIPIFCDTSHLADALVGCESMYRHVLMSVVIPSSFPSRCV